MAFKSCRKLIYRYRSDLKKAPISFPSCLRALTLKENVIYLQRRENDFSFIEFRSGTLSGLGNSDKSALYNLHFLLQLLYGKVSNGIVRNDVGNNSSSAEVWIAAQLSVRVVLVPVNSWRKQLRRTPHSILFQRTGAM